MSYSPRQLWYWWRTLNLPWRRRRLCGIDLQGNTFWEFKDALRSGRNRRIVKSRWKTHHGDVNLAPQWTQWLRHTRADPPTVREQQLDQARQVQLKQLAAEADRRWAEKPSYLDAPDKQKGEAAAQVTPGRGDERRGGGDESSGPPPGRARSGKDEMRKASRDARAKHQHQHSGGSAQDAQPGTWTPSVARGS